MGILPRSRPELQEAPPRQECPRSRTLSARSRHGTRKPADTRRFSCCFSQRWKLYRNTAETTRTHGIKQFQARARPRNGQEPGRPRGPSGGGGLYTAGRAGPQEARESLGGSCGPPSSCGGAHPVLPAFSHTGSLLTPHAPRGPEGRPGGQTIRCRPARCLEPPTWAWAWTRAALGKLTLGPLAAPPSGGPGPPVGPELTPQAAGRGGLAFPAEGQMALQAGRAGRTPRCPPRPPPRPQAHACARVPPSAWETHGGFMQACQQPGSVARWPRACPGTPGCTPQEHGLELHRDHSWASPPGQKPLCHTAQRGLRGHTGHPAAPSVGSSQPLGLRQ